jgi:hypothetical protein
MSAYCDEHGIVQDYTNSYSPQENGIVERATGIVLPRMRAHWLAQHAVGRGHSARGDDAELASCEAARICISAPLVAQAEVTPRGPADLGLSGACAYPSQK